MEMVYLLKKNKIINGPYNIETLKQRGIKSTDMVWCKGLVDWTPISQVDFLVDVPVIHSRKSNKTIIERVFSFLK
ncbi:MAG: DUF4339 domain-containing protein [Bacteroidetes bacterium]|nr:DUF4339 domain-containing protein [Bacteroidota bacterium]MBS1648814.1 DUF4339 domain-containing protein [Bacteroidota bacterium]